MPNSIERDVYVLRDTLKNPISYVRGTDLLPIIFHFRDFTIPSGATAKAFVSKNDGNAVYGGATITGNDVTVDVTQQMFITLGVNLMQVEIDSGNETLVTFEQPVMATPNLKAGDLPDSTTDVDFIDKIIEQAQEAVNDANAALETANTAISGANTAAESANSAAQNANNAAEELQDKVDAGDFTASVQVGTTTTLEPGQDATVSNGGTSKDAVFNFGIPKGDPGTAATIQVGTTQTVQPEENAEVTNSGTTTAAVLDFKIPRGKDGMTDLTAEYKDASEYTCQPTVNAPVVVKELGGKTEQGENPSPDNPQAIKGVGGMGYFDGEWVQGNISSTGTIGTETTGITSANAIPCKQNDNIAVPYEDSIDVIAVAFYNASGAYISTSTSGNSVDTFTATAPANAASFKVNLRVVSGSTITPNGAKYCTVTINGQYQTGVEVTGKNLFDASKFPTGSSKGVTITYNGNGSFALTGQGKLEENYNLFYDDYELPNKLKTGKIYANFTGVLSYFYVIFMKATDSSNIMIVTPSNKNEIAFELTEDLVSDCVFVRFGIYGASGIDIKSTIFRPMIYQDGDGTYQPYHHTALSIPLTAPLYEGDKICYVEPGESYVDAEGETVVADGILYGAYRENAVVVFDGGEDENIGKSTDGENTFSCTITNKVGSSIGGEQYLKCNKLTTTATNVSASNMPDNSIKESGEIGSNAVILNISEAGTTVESLRAWLSTNPLTVVYRLAQPYFKPFADQAPFYTLRTDDTLSYVYSSDPINPNVTVDVAKNETGGLLLESYATAQKNALAEADNASRLASVEQQLLTLNTTVSTMGGAVNDLKANTYALKGGTAIPENADLNDYKTPGNYYCESDTTVATLQNCPVSHAFTLKVICGNGVTYPLQIITDYSNQIQATRRFASSSQTWDAFRYLTPTTQS